MRKYKILNNKFTMMMRIIALLTLCLLTAATVFGCADNNNVNTDDVVFAGGNGGSKETQNTSKPSTEKKVALTFDDGPHNVRSKKIADELDKYGYNATFFVVGNRVAAVEDKKLEYNGAEAIKYVASKGNEIGIHGYTHNVYYNKCEDEVYKAELANTKKAITSTVRGAKVKLMRPIGGAITSERVENCEYAVIMWSVDSEDWKYRESSDEIVAKTNIDTIVDNVMSVVKSGDIILMHDIYENTYEATKIILKQLNQQGYDVVTVSELLGNPAAGAKYSRRPSQTQDNSLMYDLPNRREDEI